MYGDFSNIFDDISRAARNFREEFSKYAQERYGCGEDNDWPPANIYTGGGGIVFEFALAGFAEEDINLAFKGDYMLLSAVCKTALKNCGGQAGAPEGAPSGVRYLKKSLRTDPVEKQKYHVPADKYAHEKTKAVYKDGLLSVSIPAKDGDDFEGGVKIKIER